MTRVEIRTRDGVCPSYVARPPGEGPFPAVLVFMDGVGIRPAMLEVGDRLATHGFFVLLPDLFYRSGPYEPMNAKTVFADPEERKVLTERFLSRATPANVMSDTRAFLEWLDAEPAVRRGGIGVVGYCMGGRLALVAAGTYPDRIVAAAAYHPGRPATEDPDSPHLLAPRIEARVYVAQAMDDRSFPEDMRERLERALTEAGVDHRIEPYPARHGFVLRDTLAYDPAAAERHWRTLVALLDAKLR